MCVAPRVAGFVSRVVVLPRAQAVWGDVLVGERETDPGSGAAMSDNETLDRFAAERATTVAMERRSVLPSRSSFHAGQPRSDRA